MTQKDRVTNLFGFLMDLLEEQPNTKLVNSTKNKITRENVVEILKDTNTEDTNTEDSLDSLKGNKISDLLNKSSDLFKTMGKSKELMDKIDDIGKRNADELGKTRIEKKVTQPLIAEIEKLKAQARVGVNEDKEKEELETIIGDVGEKLGVTIDDGEVKIIPVSNELRDKIPLDDLPKHIKDKLETGPKLYDINPNPLPERPTVKYGLDTLVNTKNDTNDNTTTGDESIVENNNEE